MAGDTKKDRWFSCVTYCPEDVVKKVIETKRAYIRSWAYIIHDKENDIHIHVLLRTYQSYTFKAIMHWFDDCREAVCSANTFVQKIIDKSAAYDYLTHKYEPDKVHYEEDNIVGQNINDFSEAEQSKDSSFEIIQDMLKGVPYRSLAFKYGRDFIYHHKAYNDVVKEIKYQEMKEINKHKVNDLNQEFDYDIPMFESLLKDTII